MRNLLYQIFAVCFHVFRIFPVKQNRVVLLRMHNEGAHGALDAIHRELRHREAAFQITEISREAIFAGPAPARIKGLFRFFTKDAYAMATAAYIFLNDNFMPLGSLHFGRKTKLVQLWHGDGCFKRFGLDKQNPDKVTRRELRGNQKLDLVVCSSDAAVPVWADAFQVPEARVKALGSARADYFFRSRNLEKMRIKFDEQYPACAGKKLVLYAPTFRDNAEQDAMLLQHFDVKTFLSEFGDEYALLIRLHPQIHAGGQVDLPGVTDVTSYSCVNALLLLADVLIADYSSVIMPFALLGKPMLFYAFDLKDYEADRGFYRPYAESVPGKVVKTMDDLIGSIRNETYEMEKIPPFCALHYKYKDANSSQRIVDAALEL